MKLKNTLVVILLLFAHSFAKSQVIKILFDATKSEMSGNADWVIDASTYNIGCNTGPSIAGTGNESNPSRFPIPAQSGITASTLETYWTGGLSHWAIDCVNKGFQVETLPYNGQITFGSLSNLQDLSYYKIFIVCEPNIIFSSSEKTALLSFVQSGGSLFMISDHAASDRNNDGNDSPQIWDDFFTNNGVVSNPFGISFDNLSFSNASTNVKSTPTNPIINGPAGNVTQVLWSSGTSITMDPIANSSVKGFVWKSTSLKGSQNVLVATALYGAGKVAAFGDSSPPDDGTGDINDVLYDGYITDAAGNHQKLLMNLTIWLASSLTGIEDHNVTNGISMLTNNTQHILQITFSDASTVTSTINVYDITGRKLTSKIINVGEKELKMNTSELSSGIYIVQVLQNGESFTRKIFIEN